jgi:hypothetical protein
MSATGEPVDVYAEMPTAHLKRARPGKLAG